jgi:hypothetical protein
MRGQILILQITQTLTVAWYQVTNKSSQQMRLILYLYFVCFLSPYMFRAFTGPSSGVSLAVVMLPFGSCSVVDCSFVRGGHQATSTDARTVNNTARTKW